MKLRYLLPLLIVSAGPAWAQTAAPPAPARAPAPAPVPAPSAAKLALAHDVIQGMQVEKMVGKMTGPLLQMALMQLPKGDTPEAQAQVTAVEQKIRAMMSASTKEMLSKMDVVYAEVYSEAELDAMRAFYTSPEGQSVLDKQPLVQKKMMPLVMQMRGELLPKIRELITAETQPPAPPAAAPVPATPSAPAPAAAAGAGKN